MDGYDDKHSSLVATAPDDVDDDVVLLMDCRRMWYVPRCCQLKG